jgi:hypothetical protein
LGVSGVLRPILGGFLLDYGWQWLFIINTQFQLLFYWEAFTFFPGVKKTTNSVWTGQDTNSGFAGFFPAYAINQIDTSNFLTSFFSLSVWPSWF